MRTLKIVLYKPAPNQPEMDKPVLFVEGHAYVEEKVVKLEVLPATGAGYLSGKAMEIAKVMETRVYRTEMEEDFGDGPVKPPPTPMPSSGRPR